jgi:hypothetical protein
MKLLSMCWGKLLSTEVQTSGAWNLDNHQPEKTLRTSSGCLAAVAAVLLFEALLFAADDSAPCAALLLLKEGWMRLQVTIVGSFCSVGTTHQFHHFA